MKKSTKKLVPQNDMPAECQISMEALEHFCAAHNETVLRLFEMLLKGYGKKMTLYGNCSRETFAQLYGCSVNTVDRAIKDGELKVCRLGNNVRIPHSEVIRFVTVRPDEGGIPVEDMD